MGRTDFESTGPDEDPFLLRSLSSLLITNVYFGTAHTGFNLRSQTREAGNVLRRALYDYYKLEDRLAGAREMQSFGYADFKDECRRRQYQTDPADNNAEWLRVIGNTSPAHNDTMANQMNQASATTKATCEQAISDVFGTVKVKVPKRRTMVVSVDLIERARYMA